MAHLSLSCLGPFHVMLDGQPVTGFKSNKVRGLLAYLAVESERPHHREVLAGLLWPDWPDSEALSNLRYALSNLPRIDLEADAVRCSDIAVRLAKVPDLDNRFRHGSHPPVGRSTPASAADGI